MFITELNSFALEKISERNVHGSFHNSFSILDIVVFSVGKLKEFQKAIFNCNRMYLFINTQMLSFICRRGYYLFFCTYPDSYKKYYCFSSKYLPT